ncbi:DUF448 domain-containing protein [Candidatus Peregrinibacteria bacterium]|nr:DUF448 domain-containing protein [Candidatus Peregrinibacteria bacterium]
MAKKKVKKRRPRRIPQRMCVICRQRFDKRRLTRLVRTPDAGVVVDVTGKRNGRGAYLCDQPICWQKALANIRILDKALRTTITEAEKEAIAAHQPNSSPTP